MPSPPSAEGAHARWASRHDGLDPASSPWVSGWARLTDALARPLARWGVSPDVVTLVGVLVVVPAPLLAALGGAWPLAVVLLVVAGAVLDGVDGALASLTGRGTSWGRVLDPLADRVSDLLLIALLVVVVGSPWAVGVGVATALLTLLLESTRASAQLAGMPGPGAVTVWERPSRVIVPAFGSGLTGIAWLVGVDVPWLPAAWLLAGLALAATGLLQLLLAARRVLRSSGWAS